MALNTKQVAQSRASSTIIQMLLACASVAVVTGVALLPSYKASPEAANQSVQAIQSSSLTAALRGMHHWASALLILLGGAFVVVALFNAAHRYPHRGIWIGTIAFTGVCLLLQLTGHLLPFDQQSVRTAAIETGIAGGAPGIGSLQANLLRGGSAVGPATLTTWYRAHAYVLPFALLAAGLFLFARLRRDQVTLNKGATLVSVALLIGLGIAVAAPLGSAASAADYGSFEARPEWYVLPLHALLGFFQSINPNLAFVGTMAIPALVALFLIALPWLDRGTGRKGKPVAIALTFAVLGLFLSNMKIMAPPVGIQMAGVTSGSDPKAAADPTLVAEGKAVFDKQRCSGCHTVSGAGGKMGPDLTLESARHADIQWQIMHLKDPPSMTPGSTMPAFPQLSDADARALANYLISKK